MFSKEPVKIPDIPGKITFRTKGENRYVQYQLNRIYDKNTKQSRVDRCEIGVVIPGKPDMMLPNDNYRIHVPEVYAEEYQKFGDDDQAYLANRERCFMLRDLFDQLFFEFQMMSRKDAKGIVNENKVERLNKVLEPLLEMMKGKSYTDFLETIPMPEEETTENGEKIIKGLTYSDVALLMTQFKGALNIFFRRKI